MKLISLRCPRCDAELEVDPNIKVAYCQYCGNKLIIDDEIQRQEITHIYRDEARIREADAHINEIEYEKEWQSQRSKAMKRWGKICACLILIGVIVAALGLYIKDTNKDIGSIIVPIGLLIASVGLMIIVLGIEYFTKSEKWHHRSNMWRSFTRKR